MLLTRPGNASGLSASASSTSKSTAAASAGRSLRLALPGSEYWIAYGSPMVGPVQRRRGGLSLPNRDDADATRCAVDHILDFDAFASCRALQRGGSGTGVCRRFELRAIRAEFRHQGLKLDPVCDVQRRALLHSVAIEGDCIGILPKGGALQDRVLAFVLDLRRLDFLGPFQQVGRNRNEVGAMLLA